MRKHALEQSRKEKDLKSKARSDSSVVGTLFPTIDRPMQEEVDLEDQPKKTKKKMYNLFKLKKTSRLALQKYQLTPHKTSA